MDSKMKRLPRTFIALLLAVLTMHQVTGQTPAPAPAYCDGQHTATKPNPTEFRPNPPRVYPFCVGKDPETGQWDDTLEKSGFASIIDEINKRNEPHQTPPFDGFKYRKRDHLFDDPTKEPATIFRTTTHLHVHMLQTPVKSGLKFMDNWLLLDFLGMFLDLKYVEKQIHGVYIQGIQGPLGIPFGEFIMHDNYKKGTYDEDIADYFPQSPPPNDWMKISKAYPCTFYSKAGPTIPNVFLFSSKLKPGRGLRRQRVRALIRWDDPVCAEVAFMQFLVIIVHDWGNQQAGHPAQYRVGVSPIVLLGNLQYTYTNPNGLAYPYYPDWGKKELVTYRNKQVVTAVQWNRANHHDSIRNYRIVSNFDYEACVQHHVRLERKGPRKGACPPGPFKCSDKTIAQRPKTSPELGAWKNALWDKLKDRYLNFDPARQACSPPPPPPPTTPSPITPPPTGGPPMSTTTPRPPTQVEKNEVVIAQHAKKVERRKVISHGDLCVFIWFIVVPVANFFARFFKDFPNWTRVGIGFWIVSHVVLHHLGVLFMWISFGLVVSNGVSFLGGAGLAHYLYAFPATFFQHYELFDGFIRDRRAQTASRQSMFHVINGFLASLLSLCCCAYSGMHIHKLYLVFTMFSIDVLAVILGTILEWKISKKLGFFPARKFFPVLERVMMVNAKPKFYKLKIFMACVYILVNSLVYTAYFVYDDHISKIIANR